MDGVKIIAEGIRLEKKVTKTNAKGKRQTRRSATHDVTNIGKDNADVIIDATKTNDKSAEPADVENDSSADRTETDEEKESD